MRTFRLARRSLIAMATALALTACGSSYDDGSTDDAGSGTSSQTLRIAWGLEALTMDPPNEAGVLGIGVLHNVYQTLVSYDFDASEVQPSLAESWDVSDDGLTYSFELDPDATFADGSPVTSADVLWSFQRVLDWPEAIQGFQIRPSLDGATLEAPSETSLVITLVKPFGGFLAALSGTAASIISEAAVTEAAGEDVEEQRAWLTEHTAGSGPYQLDTWERSSYITLTRNDEFWGDEPRFESVQIEFVTESAQQVSGLRQGDLDVALDILPQQVAELEGDGFGISTGSDLSTYYLGLNLSAEPFSDPRVRDAVRYAIDYEGIIDGLLDGQAVKAGGVVAEGLTGHDPSLDDIYDHDPDHARDLLEEAGLADGFAFDLYLANDTVKGLGVPTNSLATKIQADLAEVGITANLQVQDINALFPAYRAGQLPAILWYFGPTYPDPDPVVSPHGDVNTQATTRLSYNDPEVTELILEARALNDADERGTLYEEIGQAVSSEGPYVFLFRPLGTAVLGPDVEGVRWVPIWTLELS